MQSPENPHSPVPARGRPSPSGRRRLIGPPGRRQLPAVPRPTAGSLIPAPRRAPHDRLRIVGQVAAGVTRHRMYPPMLAALAGWLRVRPPTIAQTWRQRRRPAIAGLNLASRRSSVAAVVLLLIGLVPAAIASSPSEQPARPAGATEALTGRANLTDAPSRSLARSPLAPEPQGVEPEPSPESEPEPEPEPEQAEPEPEPEPSPESEPESEPAEEPKQSEEPELPGPIGGLSRKQMEHAATIVRVGQEMGLPAQAYVVALATALQESYLRVLANPTYPESYNQPHDGDGRDHDSVGIFQQRPVSGWGTVAECMDPEHSARSFYQSLQRVSGWQNLPVTVAAQAVQVSAFPDHYAKHEPLARQLVSALT